MKNKKILATLIFSILILGITLLNTKKIHYANGTFSEKEYRISDYRIANELSTVYEVDIVDENFSKIKTILIDTEKDVDYFSDEALYHHILVREMQHNKGISIFGKEFIFDKEFKFYDSSLKLCINPITTEDYLYLDN